MSEEIPLLEPEVSRFEPREALDGGADGLMLIRRLLMEAGEHLLPGGGLVLEMDPRQIAAASGAARAHFPGASIRTVQDLAGRERVLVARRRNAVDQRREAWHTLRQAKRKKRVTP